MGCASLHSTHPASVNYPTGSDLPSQLHRQKFLLASEIRTWSAAVPEWLAAGISPGIASRIFPIIANRTATAVIPISIGVISATGVASTIVCPGTVALVGDAGRTPGCAASSGTRLESRLQSRYHVRIDPLARKAFYFFQIDAILA